MLDGVSLVVVLFAAGLLVLVLEIFVPSHGILTVVGLGIIGYAIVETFKISETAGWISLGTCLVGLPALGMLGLKVWYRTPLGRRIAPPNPVLTEADLGVESQALNSLVGSVGRATSALRPVGFCEIGGQRRPCLAEGGLIENGAMVRVIDVRGGTLVVAAVTGR